MEAGVTLGAFVWALATRSLIEARSFAFAVLVCSELMRAFAARSRTRTFWQIGAASNPRLLLAVAALLTLQFAIHHVPAAQRLFGIAALSPSDWALVVALGVAPAGVLEMTKLLARRPAVASG